MTPRALVIVTAVISTCGSACQRPVTPAQARPSTDALCTAPAAGDSSVDRELNRRITGVERVAPESRAAALVLIGRAWVQKARNSGDPGFYLHAHACATRALLMQPLDAPALNLRALTLLNGHRFAEARDLALQMLARDPEDIMALGTLSDALLELGDREGAERAAQQMMDLKPALPSYARASHLLWLRGDVTGALQATRSAYDAGRGQRDREPVAWVLTDAAHVFYAGGDLAGARAGFDKALAHLPDYAPALVGRARCDLVDGRHAAAVDALERALARQPLVETAWLLSSAHEAGGDARAAAAAFERARQIGRQTDPRMLALLLATRDTDINEAARAIDEDARARGGIWTDDVRALVAYRQGETVKAQRLMERALSWGTPEPRLWVHQALITGDRVALDRALAAGAAKDPLLAPLVATLTSESM